MREQALRALAAEWERKAQACYQRADEVEPPHLGEKRRAIRAKAAYFSIHAKQLRSILDAS